MSGQGRPGGLVGARYRLMEVLGAGGFGRVWRAHDELLDTDVAVKELVLPPGTPDKERAARFVRAEREARNAARLRDHPHVVPVHDVVLEDGAPWIVMRLVRGVSLEQRIEHDGPLPPEEATRVAVALLKALQAAHEAGIAHRDVKPANVLLTASGEVLLTDFGIAVQHGDTGLTPTRYVIGTVEYTAPERWDGDNIAPSDLFSLGATLYHAVEGVSPFRRETFKETLTAVLFEHPPTPRRATEPLATVITALLDKDPHRRPRGTQAIARLSSARHIADPDDTARKALLTRAASGMKALLARRIAELADEHGLETPVRPRSRTGDTPLTPREPGPAPTKADESPTGASQRKTWHHYGAHVITVLLLFLAWYGLVVTNGVPWALVEIDMFRGTRGDLDTFWEIAFFLAVLFGGFLVAAYALLWFGRSYVAVGGAVESAGGVVTVTVGLIGGIVGGLAAASGFCFASGGLAAFIQRAVLPRGPDYVAASHVLALVILVLAYAIRREWRGMADRAAASSGSPSTK